MAEARSSAHWDHTSQLIALLVNIHRDPKRSQAVTPDQCHPIKQRAASTATPHAPASTADVKATFSLLPTRTIPAAVIKVKER